MNKRLNFRTPLRNLFQWLKDRRVQKQKQRKLKNLKVWCMVCTGLPEDFKVEPGAIVQVCHEHHLTVPATELVGEVWKHQMVNDPLKPEGTKVTVESRAVSPLCRDDLVGNYREDPKAAVVEGKMYGLPECKMETGQAYGLGATWEDLRKQVLSRERAQAGGTRFSIMLWEVRFLLRSLGKSNPKAKTLGDELESYMEGEPQSLHELQEQCHRRTTKVEEPKERK